MLATAIIGDILAHSLKVAAASVVAEFFNTILPTLSGLRMMAGSR
jgi:hypothetical protein